MPTPNAANKPSDFKSAGKNPADDAAQKTQQAANVVENWFAQGREQFDRFSQTYGNGPQEQFEALAKSGSLFAKGVEDIFKTCTNFTQDLASRNAEGFKTLLGARSLSEATETHSRLLQDNIDSLLGNATTLSQLGVRVTTEALEPISSQVSGIMRKAGSRAA